MYKVDNAIIMAAGTSSRFAPLSYELPKALIKVKGEVLIERQIKQIKEAGIDDIYVIVGYKKEMFYYLKDKFGVKIIENNNYLTRNNNSSIYLAKDIIKNSYICSSDNYFASNPFECEVEDSYYSAVYSKGLTKEWCLTYDKDNYITDVKIGGKDCWYMLGHTFWSEKFSQKFIEILNSLYNLDETKDKLWESIYIDHINELKMKIKKYSNDIIFEFDTLDELREFDKSYIDDTNSIIIKDIAKHFNCEESELNNFVSIKNGNNAAAGFSFKYKESNYKYEYETKKIIML